MIKVENCNVYNFDNAIRGARNPHESWDNIDSGYGCEGDLCNNCSNRFNNCYSNNFIIGENDLTLLQKLIKAGHPSHSKFMRQIMVSMDITAPLYWWKEFDTYKVGTVANSTSTMHKLSTTPITKDCFSFDEEFSKLPETEYYIDDAGEYLNFDQITIRMCEELRQKYLETKDIRYWRYLIQLLPASWNQMRIVTLNYEVLRNMYFSRRYHKLQEWKDLCKVIESLPYGHELICLE